MGFVFSVIQSCKNVPTVPTSWCYFFWPVLIFGKSTRKTGENTRKQAKNSAFLVLIFLWEKLVGANFYAFCNYAYTSLMLRIDQLSNATFQLSSEILQTFSPIIIGLNPLPSIHFLLFSLSQPS